MVLGTMQRMASRPWLIVSCLALLGCPKDTSGTGDSSSTSADTGGITLTSAPTTTESSMTSTSATTGMSASDSASTGPDTADSSADATASGSTGADSTTGNDPGNPLDCGGTTWACGDGMDNDMDGFIDLQDPECTGPCDSDNPDACPTD